jgi:hypothetical protein
MKPLTKLIIKQRDKISYEESLRTFGNVPTMETLSVSYKCVRGARRQVYIVYVSLSDS